MGSSVPLLRYCESAGILLHINVAFMSLDEDVISSSGKAGSVDECQEHIRSMTEKNLLSHRRAHGRKVATSLKVYTVWKALVNEYSSFLICGNINDDVYVHY